MVSVLPETVALPPLLLLLPQAETTAARATRQIPATNQRARKVFSLLLDLTIQTATRDATPVTGGAAAWSAARGRSGPGAFEVEPAAVEPVGPETDRRHVAGALDGVRADGGAPEARRERGGRHRRAVVGVTPGAVDRVDREPRRLVSVERARR